MPVVPIERLQKVDPTTPRFHYTPATAESLKPWRLPPSCQPQPPAARCLSNTISRTAAPTRRSPAACPASQSAEREPATGAAAAQDPGTTAVAVDAAPTQSSPAAQHHPVRSHRMQHSMPELLAPASALSPRAPSPRHASEHAGAARASGSGAACCVHAAGAAEPEAV